MSGGYWNYQNDSAHNEIFQYASKPWNALEDREISELVWDVMELLHAFDWYKSGDTCEETYLKKKQEFKKKWFGSNRGLRIRRIVDDACAGLKDELYKTFGVEE